MAKTCDCVVQFAFKDSNDMPNLLIFFCFCCLICLLRNACTLLSSVVVYGIAWGLFGLDESKEFTRADAVQFMVNWLTYLHTHTLIFSTWQAGSWLIIVVTDFWLKNDILDNVLTTHHNKSTCSGMLQLRLHFLAQYIIGLAYLRYYDMGVFSFSLLIDFNVFGNRDWQHIQRVLSHCDTRGKIFWTCRFDEASQLSLSEGWHDLVRLAEGTAILYSRSF